ncbi:MAG TPA: zinc-dependent metalloprotease family protein, partial [Xanthomonadales bacterium]|nr:zinc-dependent metalloprotease family protein [Xanthomonadales bacterium]
DPAAAIAYLGDLFAYSSGLYEREIDTNLLITQVRLFSTNHDPYELMNAGCGGDGALDEVQNEWDGNSTPRTLVHLVSGKDVGQGCAYVGVLCHQSDGYGASMGIGGNFNIDNPDVIWDNMVIAHEVGHNFNSPHTHNYCGIAGIDDPVDKCVVSGDPDDVDDSCTASDPALPGPGSLTGGTAGSGNGTVMSYCHFRSGGFGNFSWTFGEFHPDGIAPFRVPDRMRAHVADNTSCMALQYTGPDLQVFKDCKPDDPALVGQTGICTIVVENKGTEIALGVVTEDLFLSNGTFNFGAVTATKGDDLMDAGTCTASANPQVQSGDVSCNLEDLDAGHKVTIKVPVTAATPQNVNDRVTVSSDSPDSNPANNMAEDTLTFIANADLTVSKLCKPDGDLLAGANGVCTIIIQNLGPSAAASVQLVDTHVSNLAFTIDGVSPVPTCGVAGDVVTCNYTTLAAGESRQVDVTISEDNPMDINDTATVSSSTPDPDSSNNSASDGLHIVGLADLSISKSDTPDPVVAGEQLTYTIQVTNGGPSTAQNVVVTDVLPAGTSVVSVTPTSGQCIAGVPGDPAQPVVCTLGNIADGVIQAITIVLEVLPGTTGVLLNTATVSSDTLDNNQANNQASATTNISVETDLLNLVKTDDPDPVLAGAELKYLVTLTNDGASTA